MQNKIDKRPNESGTLPCLRSGVSPERERMNQALARIQELAIPPAGRPRPAGRLACVLDLTSSRSKSLKKARIATAAMFDTIKAIGSIALKLIYYRGSGECEPSAWEHDPARVTQEMLKLSCEAGRTQIAKALGCVLGEIEPVSAVVFIGDHCEDDRQSIRDVGIDLGRKGIPVFVFHECRDWDSTALEARPIFQQLAEVSGGVYSEFNPDSAEVLRELLTAVAVFSTAGANGIKQLAPATTPQARALQGRLLLGAGGPPAKRG